MIKLKVKKQTKDYEDDRLEEEDVLGMVKNNGQRRRGFIPRKYIEQLYAQNFSALKEMIRRKVLEENRVDILANYVLGYEIADHHDRMWKFFNRPGHPDGPRRRGILLAPRGSGKTHILNYSQIVCWILQDPNERILITSDTQLQAEAFLRVIKAHLEDPFLVAIFGQQRGAKWDTREINVAARTCKANESTVTCIGCGGGLTSKHFTKIIVDDLVDEENSRTQHQRDLADTWVHKTLYNAVEKDVIIWFIGTYYHWDDIYRRLSKKHEYKEHILRVPALTYHEELVTEDNPEGALSYWPSHYPTKELLAKKRELGIHWYTQMQMEIDREIGEYFNPNWISIETDYPRKNIRIWQGVDLQVSKSESSAFFAHSTIVETQTKPKHFYIVDAIRSKPTAKRQTEIIVNQHNDWDPIKVAIEGNAFQAIKEQEVKELDEDVRVKLLYTDKDKITEAMKLQPSFEDGRWHVLTTTEWVRDLLATFPSKESLDVFDSINLAYKVSRSKRRRRRRREPGLI